MRTHKLKTWPAEFDAVWLGLKPFEWRYDDRNFQVGDRLHLLEYDPSRNPPPGHPEHGYEGKELQYRYTGREMIMEVTYVLRGPSFNVPQGYVIMGIRRVAVVQSFERPHRNAIHSDYKNCRHCGKLLDPLEACSCKDHG